jgi:hypothetical protein
MSARQHVRHREPTAFELRHDVVSDGTTRDTVDNTRNLATINAGPSCAVSDAEMPIEQTFDEDDIFDHQLGVASRPRRSRRTSRRGSFAESHVVGSDRLELRVKSRQLCNVERDTIS